VVREAHLRLPDDLAQALTDDVKQKGLPSENEYMIQALRHFLKCTKTDESASMKLIVLRYATTCLKCHHSIEAGKWALYGKGIGAICIDCYVERIGDKATVAKFLKNREYDQTIKAMKREAERLADKVEVLVFAGKLDEYLKKFEELRILGLQYMKQPFVKEEEQQKATENLLRVEEELKPLLTELTNFWEKRIKPKKWLQIPQEG